MSVFVAEDCVLARPDTEMPVFVAGDCVLPRPDTEMPVFVAEACDLFKDSVFVQTVKKRWEVYKGNILGNSQYKPFLDYMEDIASTIKVSANRDIALWGNKYFTLSGEASAVRGGFVSKIEWMDREIQKL